VISAKARAADRWRSTLSEKERVVREARGEPVKKFVVVRSGASASASVGVGAGTGAGASEIDREKERIKEVVKDQVSEARKKRPHQHPTRSNLDPNRDSLSR
jgi:hypothetical protein